MPRSRNVVLVPLKYTIWDTYYMRVLFPWTLPRSSAYHLGQPRIRLRSCIVSSVSQAIIGGSFEVMGWSERATEAFQALKKALCSAPVLALPNFQ